MEEEALAASEEQNEPTNEPDVEVIKEVVVEDGGDGGYNSKRAAAMAAKGKLTDPTLSGEDNCSGESEEEFDHKAEIRAIRAENQAEAAAMEAQAKPRRKKVARLKAQSGVKKGEKMTKEQTLLAEEGKLLQSGKPRKKTLKKPKMKAIEVEKGVQGSPIAPPKKKRVGRPLSKDRRRRKSRLSPADAELLRTHRPGVGLLASPAITGYVDGTETCEIPVEGCLEGLEHMVQMPVFDIKKHNKVPPAHIYDHTFYQAHRDKNGKFLVGCRWEDGPFSWEFGDCHSTTIPTWELPEWEDSKLLAHRFLG